MRKAYFEVVRTTIGEVYYKPQNRFRIPRFQRQYTWDEKQVEEFWETITLGIPTFLGTVIFNIKDKHTDNIIEIIDGQQRCFTIQIFGAVARDIILEEGLHSGDKKYRQKADGVHKRILGSQDDDDDETFYSYLIPGDSIKEFFEKYIQNNSADNLANIEQAKVTRNSEQYKVKNAYFKFRQLIREYLQEEITFSARYSKLIDLIDKKLSHHFFVKIQIDDEDLAYEIFETVNAKGVDLSVADLIKNQIFRNVTGGDGHVIDVAKEKWNGLLETLEGLEFSLKDFLSYYWTSKYSYVSDKNLYTEIRWKFQSNSEEWVLFLDDLVKNANYLELILSGSEDDFVDFFNNDRGEAEKAYKSLRILRSLKAKTWIILYLCLFRNLSSDSRNKMPLQIKKRWEIFDKFTFLYFHVLNLPGNWYFKLISDTTRRIEIGIEQGKDQKYFAEVLRSLFSGFKEKMPNSVVDFKEGFSAIQYRDDPKSRVVIRYVLNELEEHSAGSFSEGYDESKVSIEHILPRNPKQWRVTKTACKPYVNSIGNLVLISKYANGTMGDSPLNEKLEYLKESKLHLVKDLLEKIGTNEWAFHAISEFKDFGGIERRLEDLSDSGYDIWVNNLRSKMGF
ncbi:DUF262 domain-containing protein [Parapedobacter sp.]